MPTYDRSPATGYRVVDRWRGGVGWLAHPNETGVRASHAIETDDGVLVIDPVDAPGIDDLLAEFGEVTGVAVLSSYHARDAGAVARRHDAVVRLPRWMKRVAERVDAPIERYEDGLPGTGFEVHKREPLRLWQEAIAYREADGTLVVPDLLGTAPGYTVGNERVGVVLSHRLHPPRDLFAAVEPERILFGHGEGVFSDASGALRDALSGARRRFPRALVGQLWTNLRLLVGAMGE